MPPEWLWRIPLNLIYRHTYNKAVGRDLVVAIIMVESSGFPFTSRYEPAWKYFKDVEAFARRNHITQETEKIHQATSWGPMQIMGSVARELGYYGHLNRLAEVDNGIRWGVAKLDACLKRWDTVEDAISAYNQGGPYTNEDGEYRNQDYVDKVHNYLSQLRGGRYERA